jgi:protease PrsW
MTLALLSLLAAVVPMVFYLIVIWKLDRYDREPLWLVILNFLWGAVGAIIFGFLGSVLLLKTLSPVLYSSLEKGLSSIVIAPFVEEIAKGAFLLFVTSPMKDFDNMTDGVVYGASIGLGFGMTENFLYFLNATGDIDMLLSLIVVRSIFSAVMHACSTAAFGAIIGYAKFDTKRKKGWIISSGLLLAMLIHFVWNYSVQPGRDSMSFMFGAIFILFSVIVMFGLFQVSLRTEGKLIKRELQEEAKLGTIPDEHMNYLPYTHLRNKKDWLAPTIDHQRYIKIATTLAFRKQQSRTCPPRKKAFYLQEVEDAREEISYLLYGTPI